MHLDRLPSRSTKDLSRLVAPNAVKLLFSAEGNTPDRVPWTLKTLWGEGFCVLVCLESP